MTARRERVAKPEPEPPANEAGSLIVRPIGRVHCELHERMQAPRQARAAGAVEGTIELFPRSGMEHALEDLASFRFIWVLFWFHRNEGFRPKVLPPRSLRRRGVFATRAPYRPNPIGMSAVELFGIDGLCLRVRNLDMLDGTPVLDLKPYVPYADAIPEAAGGWLAQAPREADPLPDYEVVFAPLAAAQLTFLAERGAPLEAPLREILRLGPQPHPYRRIRKCNDGFSLAYKEWRCRFSTHARTIHVDCVKSGYRPRQLFRRDQLQAGLELHREFVERFG